MFCERCGKNNPNDAAVCVWCGMALQEKPSSVGSSVPYGFVPASDLGSTVENKDDFGRKEELSGAFVRPSSLEIHGGEASAVGECSVGRGIPASNGYEDKVTKTSTTIARMKKETTDRFEIPKVRKRWKTVRIVVILSFIAVAVLTTIMIPLMFKSEEKLVTAEQVAENYVENLKEKDYAECVDAIVEYRRPDKAEFEKKWEKVEITSYEIEKTDATEEVLNGINDELKKEQLEEVDEEEVCLFEVEYKQSDDTVNTGTLQVIKTSDNKWEIYKEF